MIMADVFMYLFLILGTLIVVICYWLLFEAFSPTMVERSRKSYSTHPIRLFVIGVLCTVPLFVLGAGIASAPNPLAKILGIGILLLLLLAGLFGSAGLSRHVGTRLQSPTDENQPWRRVLRGGIVLSVTFVLPFAGWFLVLPVTLVSGVGAAVTTLLGSRKEAALPPTATAGGQVV